MVHEHGHPHEHPHHHENLHDERDGDAETRALLDPAIADSDLSPAQLTRRSVFRAAGLIGGTAAAGSLAVGEAAAAPGARAARPPLNRWLAGDHHIHTQFSSDAMYRVIDQVQQGRAHGLDWMVITDHGSVTHAKIGVNKVNPEIRRARAELPDTLVFQGLEWNIPAAEHGTVFVHPGEGEVSVLRQFENRYDGSVNGTGLPTPANEREAVRGIQWLGRQVDEQRVQDALMLANHPSRKGIDSPHEVRAWRDADPQIAVGMEGAPGHQAAGLPYGAADARGYYGNDPGSDAFPGYPVNSYRTWGGFDWMTSTVGGLWDSLLAEGKGWWISANSDSHSNFGDTSMRGEGGDFATDGQYPDPVYAGGINLDAGDYWPGLYSRTHVGTGERSYAAVMQGIRLGRVWVDHGRLAKAVDVRVRPSGSFGNGVPLGGTLMVRPGTRVEVRVTIVPQDVPNWSQFVPRMNRVDLVRGAVDLAGPADRDTFTAPDTRVVRQWDTSNRSQPYTLTYQLGAVEEPTYVRVRGTDGNRSAPGALGADIDPAGPAVDVVGDADPWVDLWMYTNPIWVLPR